MASSFRVATWNVLATAYIRKSFYPGVAPELLDPARRVPALVRRAVQLPADILCLQEVEPAAFDALESGLAVHGYAGRYAPKDGAKPDGCAIFYRTGLCTPRDERRLVYRDGETGVADSGHIAQILSLDVEGTPVTLATTHLKWDPPSTPEERQVGVRQIRLVLEWLSKADFAPAVQVICGDFNATSGSPVVELLRSAGFDHSHRRHPEAFTCNSNRQPKVIDYLFFRGRVSVVPHPVPEIDSSTLLPSLEEPSDHLPLIATFTPAD